MTSSSSASVGFRKPSCATTSPKMISSSSETSSSPELVTET
jgi:hypothetical protein